MQREAIHVFIFREEAYPNFPSPPHDHPTVISPGDIVMIPGEIVEINGREIGRKLDKYYRVLGESERSGTHAPHRFMFREEGKAVRGWRFEAEEITDEETIEAIRGRKSLQKPPYLVLNPKSVEEVEKTQ